MGNSSSPPPFLKDVDLRKYNGMYEEIARFPFQFEDDKGDRAAWFFEIINDDLLLIQYKSWDMFGLLREEKLREGKLYRIQPDLETLFLSFTKPLFSEAYSVLDMQDENDNYLILVNNDNYVKFILSRKSQITKTEYAKLKTKLAYKYHVKVESLVENRKAVKWD
jgi:lipocalin